MKAKTGMKKPGWILLAMALIFTGCQRGKTESQISSGQKQAGNKTESEATKEQVRQITDMAGRTVTIPQEIKRLCAIHPIPSHMIWRLAPLKMAGIDYQFKDRMLFMPQEEKDRLLKLPVTGTFHNNMNTETMLLVHADVIISLTKDPNIETEQEDFNAPIVAGSKDSLKDYEEMWRLIGKVVGEEKTANELADYWETTMSKVTAITKNIPEDKKLKVYYAQPTPTTTVGSESIMYSLIRMAGGITFFDHYPITKGQEQSESIPVSMEQIIAWNPDVIIAKSVKSYNEIMSNSQWSSLAAVKNKRVYVSLTYAMLDRIQSLMGLLWTAQTLYPDQCRFDFTGEMKNFYKKVYLSDAITDEQIYEKIE